MVLVRALPSARGDWFRRSLDIENFIKNNRDQDLYYGVGTRLCREQSAQSVHQIPAVWVDVDTKDFDSEEKAKEALWFRAPFRAGFWTTIVKTGGGYHAYLRLKEPAEKEDFQKIVAINRAITKDIGGDIRATDIARILRLPGTLNRKYDPPRQVAVVFDSDNEAMLSELGEYYHIDEEKIESPQEWPERVRTLVDRCMFLKHARDNQATLSEPLWYDMISNLCSIRGCVSAIHEMSRGYPRYSKAETDRKILHALGTRPCTCEKIRRDGYDCPMMCDVLAPAGLEYRIPVQVETEKKQTPEETEDLKRIKEAIPTSGWIADYVSAIRGTMEAPSAFHLAMAYGIMAAAIGRKARVQWYGGGVLYPNLWICLLAPSSEYHKTQSIRAASSMMHETGIVRWPQEFSLEQLAEELSVNPEGVWVWEELGLLLSRLNGEGYMQGGKDLLSELYDCPDLYERALRGKRYTAHGVCPTAIAGTNTDWLIESAKGSDIRGGFLARWLFVPHHKHDNLLNGAVPAVLAWDKQLRLKKQLNDWTKKESVEFSMTRVIKLKAEMEREMLSLKKKSDQPEIMGAVFSRLNTSIMKIALLDHIATGAPWGSDITEESYLRASAFGRYVRDAVGSLIQLIPRTQEDRKLAEIAGKVKTWMENGNVFATTRDICRMVGGTKDLVTKAIESLVYQGRLVEVEYGRKKVYQFPKYGLDKKGGIVDSDDS